MFEILFLLGLLGWLGALLVEYLYALPSFGSLAAGVLFCPVVAGFDYLTEKRRIRLDGVGTSRQATPPELFYWPWRRARLLRQVCAYGIGAIPCWWALLRFPIGSQQLQIALLGLGASALAVLTTGRFLSRLFLYFNASQWFDRMTPWIVGYCRRTLYRISDNPEFLGDPSFDQKPSGEKID